MSLRWVMKIRQLMIILLILSIVACHSQDKASQKQRIITVYPRSNTSHLFYNGIVKPIREDLVLGPASGVVTKMNFHYGEAIKKGDALMTLHSSEMENEFREAISNYLRNKQSYLNSKKSMAGTEMLFREKIISEQEHANEVSQFQNTTLGFIQAGAKLKQFLAYLPTYHSKSIDVETLDLNAAKDILQENMDDLIIYAPSTGIVLFPEEKTDNFKQVQVGSEIKKHDVLLEIGDLSGLSVTTNVTENDVNAVIPGRKVILTFQSDAELEMQGVIISVAKQAKNSDTLGFSAFPVVVNVPKISEQQAQKIRVGMNTKLDILIEEPPSIKIPIKAIKEINGKTCVLLMDSAGKTYYSQVRTGTTSAHDVTIITGLKKGDKVVLND